jgi:hypothetical protein
VRNFVQLRGSSCWLVLALSGCTSSFGGDTASSGSIGEAPVAIPGGVDVRPETCSDNPLLAGCAANSQGAAQAPARPTDVPANLTPNGDGSYRDREGNRVTVNARGELLDERGNLVVVGADGVIVLANPEQEEENSFRVPVVTGRLIWAANPVSGRVALVDALTREVQTLPAGVEPTYLAAVPGNGANRALVINNGSADATLFREVGSQLSQLQVPLHQGANAWTLSDDGRWAIAWSDAREFTRLDPTEGLQDVTVIDLAQASPVTFRFSVGYRPVKLQVDAGGAHVYAVTRDGISVIELGASPRLAEDIAIESSADVSSTGSGEPVLEDVPITRDGRYAVLRFDGAPQLQVIDLSLRTSQLIELPAEASDVDLAGDGRRAVAVLRDSGQVAVFEPALALGVAPTQLALHAFSGETLGSTALPESGDTALLFTNAIDSDRLAILDLADTTDASPRVVSLKAPIRAVFPTSDGSYAVALLQTETSSERAGAFSVVPIADALPPKIQGTDAPPYRVSLAETSSGLRGLVTTRDDAKGIHAAYLVRMPSLQVDRIELPSPPIAVGVLPELGVGYVAQQHPEGRITFIDLETGAPETLTGFELADRVVSGDQP